MEEGVIKRLITTIKCSSCGQHYEGYNIDVLGHSDELWFLKVLCSSCHTQCLVAAIIKGEKMAGSAIDLAATELAKFTGAQAIAGDDVLDMHDFLKAFDGDFSRLFGKAS